MKLVRRQALQPSFLIYIFLTAFLLFAANVFAGPSRTTYQAKIVKPDGYPLEAPSVNFRFTILDPSATCILYTESYSGVSMFNSGGLISFSLGSGLKTYPASSTTFEQIFSNATPNMACDTGGGAPALYTPLANDTRRIVMQFQDASGWQTLPAMTINAVPYAMYANDSQKLNGIDASGFAQLSLIPSCGASEAIRYNGASFSCVAVGGSGTVTSGSVITALGYTPADGVSVTALTSALGTTDAAIASVSATAFSVSSTVASLAGNVSSFQSTVAASFAALISSQWTSEASGISYTAGNVGIGVSNSAQNYLLHLRRSNSGATAVGIESFGTPGLYFVRSNGTESSPQAVSSSQALLEIAAVGRGPSGYINTSAAKILMSADEDWTATSAMTSMRFHTRAASTTAPSLERMRITGPGDVGIGTTTPMAKLDVSGAIRISFAADCTVSHAGTIRYNAGAVEYCNGTSWSAFGVSGAGLQSLNGSTSGTQNFAIGTVGNNPNFATANGVHTLNIPFASAATTTAGLISYNDYLTFTNKLPATSAAIVSALTYTPANSVSVTTLSSTVSSLSAQVATSFTALTSTVSAITSSQWTSVSSGIYYSGLNVGIGTSAPEQLLNLSGNSLQVGMMADAYYARYTGNSVGFFRAGPSYIEQRVVSGSINFRTSKSSTLDTTAMTIVASGSIGIGTTTPAAKLDLNGDMMITGSGTRVVQRDNDFSALDIYGGPSFSQGSKLSLYGENESTNPGRAVISYGGATAGSLAQTNGYFQIFRRNSSGTQTVLHADMVGNVGIGITSPTAKLQLSAGTADTAPLKFSQGTLLASPQSGTVEYDGNYYYITNSSNTRRAIATVANPGSFDNVSTISNLGNITLAPTGSVIVSSTAASTNAQTGALILQGGLGVAGNINASGSITTSANLQGSSITATSGMISPFVYGSTVSGGSLTLDSTTDLNKGNVLLAPAGGRVGIGTTNPGHLLDVQSTGAGFIRSQTTSATSQAGFWAGSDSVTSVYRVLGSAATGTNWGVANAGAVWLWGQTGTTAMLIGTTVSAPLILGSNHAERMRIDSSGNIGIGTSAPTTTLDVNGRISASNLNALTTVRTFTPTTLVDDTVNLGTYSGFAHGAGYLRMVIKIAGNNSSITKAYSIPLTWDVGSANWFRVVPDKVANNTLSYTEFDLEINRSGSQTANFRLRRINLGAAPGDDKTITAYIEMPIDDGTFTESSTETDAVAAHAGNFIYSGVLTQYNNNVGINITNPDAPLHVVRNTTVTMPAMTIEASGTNGRPYLLMRAENSDYGYVGFGSTGNATLAVMNYQNGPIYIGTSSTTRMHVSALGAVGIGIGANTPSNLLSNIPMTANNTNVGDAGGTGQSSNSFSWHTNAAGYAAAISNISTSAGANGLQVRTAGTTTNQTIFTAGVGTSSTANSYDVLTVKAIGNVGVRTTNPQSALHVVGNGGSLNLEGNDHTYIQYFPDGFAAGRKSWIGFANNVSNDFAFTNEIPGGHIHLRTTGAGYVGINNNNPSRLLHVGDATVGTGTPVANFQNVDGVCTITPAAAGSGIACSSDERLKENFVDIGGINALDKILKLQAVSYNFKTSPSDSRHTGYKAQELQKVLPELVREDDRGLLQVYYDGLIPFITEAIKSVYLRVTGVELQMKQQARELASVKAENAEIKAENQLLKERLDRLEKAINDKK